MMKKDNAVVFSMALEDTGLYGMPFPNLISALSSFEPNTYTLAILDIKMPKMNRYELYEKIRNIDDEINDASQYSEKDII